ncbi:MAG: hypothetical protein NZ894_05840 [Archaeoglobaceae archaeon]|nr:hypothetical protein [Archaeoglobaceae archaeon]
MEEKEKKVSLAEIWEEARLRALPQLIKEIRIEKGEIEIENIEKALKSAEETEKRLKSLKKKIHGLEIYEKEAAELCEKLVDAFIRGFRVTIYLNNILVSINVPSLAPVAKVRALEWKIYEMLRKGEPAPPGAGLELIKDIKLIDEIREAIKKEMCQSCRDPLCQRYKRGGYLQIPITAVYDRSNGERITVLRGHLEGWPLIQRTLKKIEYWDPDYYGVHSYMKVKCHPALAKRLERGTCPAREAVGPSQTFEDEEFSDPTAPDHFPGDIIGIPGEGAWKKITHSPSFGWEGEELDE